MGLYKKQKTEALQLEQSALIVEMVKDIRRNQPRLGVRKVQVLIGEALRCQGIKMGRDMLFDLLREFDLLVKPRRYKHYGTDSKHRFYKYPNQVKTFKPTSANRLWVSDITYIQASEGFWYLSLITDGYSRKIVGHSLSDSYSVEGTIKALQMALRNNKVEPGLIHHSDRGVQYCCKEYTSILENKKVLISMTQNGDPYENAIAERVNGILKTEFLKSKYKQKHDAVKAINKAVHIYNNKRPHMSIGLLTPVQAHLMHGPIKQLWKKKKQQSSITILK